MIWSRASRLARSGSRSLSPSQTPGRGSVYYCGTQSILALFEQNLGGGVSLLLQYALIDDDFGGNLIFLGRISSRNSNKGGGGGLRSLPDKGSEGGSASDFRGGGLCAEQGLGRDARGEDLRHCERVCRTLYGMLLQQPLDERSFGCLSEEGRASEAVGKSHSGPA